MDRLPQRPLTLLCAECQERFPAGPVSRPYCSSICKTRAKYVRYHRSVLQRYGGNVPEDVAGAVRDKRSFALGKDGYDDVARQLSPTRRLEVVQRAKGRCVLCGSPGAEIDHIEGPSPELTNLRYLCKPCHRAITRLHMKPIIGVKQVMLSLEAVSQRGRVKTDIIEQYVAAHSA